MKNVQRAPYSLMQMILYMLRLGSLGVGGPVALVGYMQRDLVSTGYAGRHSCQPCDAGYKIYNQTGSF